MRKYGPMALGKPNNQSAFRGQFNSQVAPKMPNVSVRAYHNDVVPDRDLFPFVRFGGAFFRSGITVVDGFLDYFRVAG